ncbi:MAG: CDP-alcohol phosphatidyltransferase family protein [Kiritimatiellia bacterium]|nr:CDP-alcohol phosphatidyltransferase family protein [Kiritimatiellia bacterium]
MPVDESIGLERNFSPWLDSDLAALILTLMTLTVPNILSLFRIVASPVLLALAWAGMPNAFIALFAAMLVSDSVDGFLARHWHQESELGAKLDSWGDLSAVMVLPVSVLLLWPDILFDEVAFIATAFLCYVVPTVFGTIKYGRPTSYHTWGAKVTAVIIGISLILLFLRVSPWPFRLCIPIVVLEAIEEMVMTAMLRKWHANVPSSWHALKIRREEEEKMVIAVEKNP